MVIYSMNQYNTEGLFSCPPVKEGVTALGAACAVKMENVTKRFGKVVANSAINLELHEGEILSLLGENGSGKTTLLSAAAGILRPAHGRIKRNGKVGYVPQSAALLEDMTFADNLRYFSSIARVRVPQVLPLEADELRPIRVRDMSGGMKKLCNLVCTLVAAPDILLLDEPYAALDEAHAAMLAAYLAAFTAGGGSLLIAAHDAKEYRMLTGRRLLLVGDGSMREETFAQAESPV